MSGRRLYLGRLSHSARERDVEKFFKGFGKVTDILLKEGYGFVEFDDDRDAEDAVYELNGKEICGERVLVEHAKPSGARRDRDSGGRFGGGSGGRFGGGGGYGRGGGGGGYGGRYGFSRAPPSRGRNPPPVRTQYRLLVSNLSSRVSWQDLKDYMRKAGEVTYADAHKLRQNEGKTHAVDKVKQPLTNKETVATSQNDTNVDPKDSDSDIQNSVNMKTAMDKLDGTELQGKKIKLSEDKSSGGRKRSRSRSRSCRSDSRDSRSYSRSRSRSHRDSRSRSKKRDKNRERSRSKDERRSYSNERDGNAQQQNTSYDNYDNDAE